MMAEMVVEMMTPDFILWQCLHGGPLSRDMIDGPASAQRGVGARYRARNKALLAKLTDLYGACAVTARCRDSVVGILRFYPKAVWQREGAGYLCLQQDFPAGMTEDFAALDFPSREALDERTLKIHCLMTRSPGKKGDLYRRRGVGSRMAQKLIEWARVSGWGRIEAEAFEDLPIIYEVTGSAGRTFWEKLGFHAAERYAHPHLREYDEFVKELEEQAARAGIDREKAKDGLIMRLDLS